MKMIKNITPKLTVLLAVLFSGVLAHAATPTVFATNVVPNGDPNGILVASGLMLVTSQTDPAIYQIDPVTKASSVFTHLPTGDLTTQEVYLALVPGNNAGWIAGDVYAVRGRNVYKILSAGLVQDPGVLFGTTPCPLDSIHTGIGFDPAGQFNYDMILTCGEAGTVVALKSDGTVDSSIGSPLAADIVEGPSVAPAFTGGNNGFVAGAQLFVAQENQNEVEGISADGSGHLNAVISTSTPNNSASGINAIDDPEGVYVVPSQLCGIGAIPGSFAGYAFFAVDEANNTILAYNLTDVSGLAGQLLIPVEYPSGNSTGPPAFVPGVSIYLVGLDGTITAWDTNLNPASGANPLIHEGSTFVGCTDMPITKSSTGGAIPGGTTFTFGLYPGTPAVAGTPNGYAPGSSPNFGSIAQAVVPPVDVLTLTPPFAGTVCELDFPTGWTFSSWDTTAADVFTPNLAGDSISTTPYIPTGDVAGEQRCVDLVIAVGTTNVALNITDAPPPPPGQVCTPGYWKTHESIPPWPVALSTTFGSVFTTGTTKVGHPDPLAGTLFSSITLEQALALQGGGFNALARLGAAAYLDSKSISFSLSPAQVVALVNEAFANGNPDYVDATFGDILAGLQNIMNSEGVTTTCPLN
jgi:hypothetical protein